MQHQNTVCHSLLKAVPRWRFERAVEAHRGAYRDRRLSFWTQFGAMVYAQLSGVQSLRELIGGLGSHGNLFYHLGLQEVRRSTLSDANRDRPAGVFAAIFDLLMPKLAGAMGREAKELVRLVDATYLPLNETLSRWAHFCAGSAGAKLHLVYDPHSDCPTYFSITPLRVNDIVEAKTMPIEPGATYVFDRGYYDFGWWAALHGAKCRFVTRLKSNSPAQIVKTLPANEPSIQSDTLVTLNARMARSRKNPFQDMLREIVVRLDTGTTLRLVTNDLEAPASEIAALYRTRWQIELFFKWVKQNLRIRKFLGTSENAVRLQIITALIAFLLIRIAHQSWLCKCSLQDLVRLIRANLMHRKSIPDLLNPISRKPQPGPQLALAIAHA